MRIFFWPDWLMIISYAVFWPIVQASIALIGSRISDRRFNPESFWLKSRKWEKSGLFYKRIFKIHKWKRFLPDGAKADKRGFRKKKLKNQDPDYLEAFIAETGRAEIFHWFQILPFWVFGLWSPPFVVWIMLAYALSVNLPCILAQRYNRPRLVNLYDHVNKRQV